MSKAEREAKMSSGDRLRQKLASVILGFEFFVIIFVTLLYFGTHTISVPAVWLIGVAVAVIDIIAIGLLRISKAGLLIGHLLQIILLVSGIWQPGVLVIAVIFIAMWIYMLYAGRRADKEAAQLGAR